MTLFFQYLKLHLNKCFILIYRLDYYFNERNEDVCEIDVDCRLSVYKVNNLNDDKSINELIKQHKYVCKYNNNKTSIYIYKQFVESYWYGKLKKPIIDSIFFITINNKK